LTHALGFPILKAMEVNFTPELEAKLDRIAEANRRVAGDYVRQLVETYVDHDVWFREKVSASLERLDRGEFLTHEEVGGRLEKILQF
jgi:predicted transcriptional regulator